MVFGNVVAGCLGRLSTLGVMVRCGRKGNCGSLGDQTPHVTLGKLARMRPGFSMASSVIKGVGSRPVWCDIFRVQIDFDDLASRHRPLGCSGKIRRGGA